MLRRLAVLALALVPALLGSTDPAAAAWAVNGAGPAKSLAVLVPQGARPTVSETTDPATYLPLYVVTWNTGFVATARPVTGYQIRRIVFPGTSIAKVEVIGKGTCAGTTVDGLPNVYVPGSPGTATQSCTDAEGYAKGDVQYTVTPVYGRWTGPTSSPSAIYS
ncbi:hypothetical protein [Blastococcus deserti]|uniref:Uncharacterized protein n=1 Tax=Blastococcus deserti TaxID=2259033 RepID=A0ABW4XDI2_9ACTN